MRNMTTITVTRLFEELQTAIGEAYRANPEAMANIRNFQRNFSWDNPLTTAVEADTKDERRWER